MDYSSSSSGLLNPAPLTRRKSVGHSRSDSLIGTNDLASFSVDSDPEFAKKTAPFPHRYRYEWHEPSFFDAKKGTFVDEQNWAGDLASPGMGHWTVPIGKILETEKILMMEVFDGKYQRIEVNPAQVMARIREHHYGVKSPKFKPKSVIGDVTFRDVRQILTDGRPSPSIEVRKNCILVCLPPVIAIILHDRALFVVTDELDTDSLLLRLEDITGTYAKRITETKQYLIPVDTIPAAQWPRTQETNSESNLSEPRFVSLPLEFAILEVLLSTAFEKLQDELGKMEEALNRVERRVTTNSPSATRLEVLHEIKNPCQLYADTVNSLAAAFRLLLSNTQDLNGMELTKFYYRPELYHEIDPEVRILTSF